MQITINDWKSYFPFSNIRKEQEIAINFILNSFYNDNKKFCICELGTGIGKSAIAVTVSKFVYKKEAENYRYRHEDLPGSYILTTQKILQEQYVKDFGDEKFLDDKVCSVNSSVNYRCTFYKDQSCSESKMLLKQFSNQIVGTKFYDNCKFNCCYSIAKSNFINSNVGVTNFAYFLSNAKFGFGLKPKDLLVIDECHTIEDEVSRFSEISFSEKFASDVIKCKLPKFSTSNEDKQAQQIIEWIKTTYKVALEKYSTGLKKAIENIDNLDVKNFSAHSKRRDMIEKHIGKIDKFLLEYKSDTWIVNIDDKNGKGYRKFEFKPIDVSAQASSLYTFGNKVLLMSATIIDNNIFMAAAGIDKNNAAYLRLPSPFPVKNKPILYSPVGKMSHKCIDDTLPKLAKVVESLIDQHKQEKGIIHCVSFKVANYLNTNVKTNRFLIHDSTNRNEILKQHINSTEPTILLSPSMSEGVDLSDEISRFQILCKIPFPYLGDKLIAKKMKSRQNWYQMQTAKTILQSVGRSIRNSNDYAVSYILDEDWLYFYRQNKHMFPQDFIESMHMV